jgi:hypothetical protein
MELQQEIFCCVKYTKNLNRRLETGVILSLMYRLRCLIVKFLGKIISVNVIRDFKESYLVLKNPKPLGMGVSVIGFINIEGLHMFIDNLYTLIGIL